MRRCWARAAAMAACFVLVVAGIGSQGLGRELGGKNSGTDHQNKHEHERSREEIRPVKVGFFTIGVHRARELNISLVEDDKRIVPTGPNPLHNR